MGIALPSLPLYPALPARGAPVLCIAGAGHTGAAAPADSWLWAVNLRVANVLPRLPDLVFGGDPDYWAGRDWHRVKGAGLRVATAHDCDMRGYDGPVHRYQPTGPRLNRNPAIPEIGPCNWSAPIALLVALTIWGGPIVIAGVDLIPRGYSVQAEFWRKFCPVLPKRVYRAPGSCGEALQALEEWHGVV